MTTNFPAPFGPYMLERFIAAGGMAEVFLARRTDGQLPGPLCVKRMLPEMTKNPEYVGMFRDEASLSQRLVHPNIVRVFDFGEHDGSMYMAMEYIDGMDVGTLVRRLRQKNEMLGVPHALKIGIDLCAGLHHAHTLVDTSRRPLKLIHRDVSPQNLLLSSRGEVKVTDFGIAKAIGRETKTATGMIKGKIAYMAPEQALGHYIDQRVDQFAAGIVVWEMLTGQRLYNEKSDILTFEKIIRHPCPKPSSVRTGIIGAIDQVVLRALAKSPDERYPDCSAFGSALTHALNQVGGVQQADLAPVISVAMGIRPSGNSGPNPVHAGAPPGGGSHSAPPAAQSTRGGMQVQAAQAQDGERREGYGAAPDAPTRLTPGAVERLPTSAMSALPMPGGNTGNTGAGMVAGRGAGDKSRSGLRPATSGAGMSAGVSVGMSVTPSAAMSGASGAAFAAAQGAHGAQQQQGDYTQALPEGELPPYGAADIPIPAARTRSTGVMPAPAQQAEPRGLPIPLLAGALVAGLVIGFVAAKVVSKPAVTTQGSACAQPASSVELVQKSAEAMKRANQAWGSGDFPTARFLAEEANAAHGTASGHLLLGRIALNSGNRLEALTQFRCVVVLDPGGSSAAELERLLNGGK